MRDNFHITIHAGEAFGLPSIAEALHVLRRRAPGPRRADHRRHRLGRRRPAPALGRLAAFVRDRRVPLELCPSSNVHVGAAPSIADHPVGLLAQLRFRVTVNTDNRLMSQTGLSREFLLLGEAFGWDLDDVRWATINAMKSAFLPFDERLGSSTGSSSPASRCWGPTARAILRLGRGSPLWSTHQCAEQLAGPTWRSAEVLGDKRAIDGHSRPGRRYRARGFHEGVLGLTVAGEPLPDGQPGIRVRQPEPGPVHLPDRGDAGKSPATLASWQVDGIGTTVKELRGGGVVFEEYDFPGLKTDDGVAALPGAEAAWFKDPDGNILNVFEPD